MGREDIDIDGGSLLEADDPLETEEEKVQQEILQSKQTINALV